MTPAVGNYGVVDLRPRGVSRLVAGAIRLITRSPWCHTFVVVGGNRVIEATPRGTRLNSLSEYVDAPYVAYNDLEPLTDNQRQVIALHAAQFLGFGYNFLDVAALALVSFGIRARWLAKRVERTDRVICSQLVDLAYSRAGVVLFTDGRLPGDVTPGDLGMRLATRPWERDPAAGPQTSVHS